ncbi:hypothetical protein DRP07_11045 [Archaeoglobales archaeon]|mgnify:CR=1 FL=1|nr:MAG: hypothetical protein DRP07_11045 [Archaeoglobales archaeon]
MEKISAIIPAYNAEKTIKECINAVLAQSYKPSEVIVVDDGSTDNTYKIASQFNEVKVIRSNINRGVASARNLGIMASKYKYIYFIDSDSFPRKKCIELLMKEFSKDEKIGIVGGSNISPEYINDKYNKAYDITNRYGHHINLQEGYVEYIGGNFCIKKEIFNKIGLYDTNLRTHEDFDLCIRARKEGYKVYFQPKAIADHYHQRITLKKYLRYAYTGGKFGTIFRLKHKPFAPFSKYLPENCVLIALLLPFFVTFATTRVIQKNIKLRPITEILSNSHLIFLNQLFMCLGMIEGAYLFKKKYKTNKPKIN